MLDRVPVVILSKVCEFSELIEVIQLMLVSRNTNHRQLCDSVKSVTVTKNTHIPKLVRKFPRINEIILEPWLHQNMWNILAKLKIRKLSTRTIDAQIELPHLEELKLSYLPSLKNIKCDNLKKLAYERCDINEGLKCLYDRNLILDGGLLTVDDIKHLKYHKTSVYNPDCMEMEFLSMANADTGNHLTELSILGFKGFNIINLKLKALNMQFDNCNGDHVQYDLFNVLGFPRLTLKTSDIEKLSVENGIIDLERMYVLNKLKEAKFTNCKFYGTSSVLRTVQKIHLENIEHRNLGNVLDYIVSSPLTHLAIVNRIEYFNMQLEPDLQIGDDFISRLPDTLINLRIQANSSITGITVNPNIRTLHLERASITKAGMQHLSTIKLVSLSLPDCKLTDDMIFVSSTVQHLELGCNQVSKQKIMELERTHVRKIY